MVRVEDEDPVHSASQDGADLVFFAGHRKGHVQEVLRVVQIVTRIDEGLTDGIFVGHGGDGRHLCDQSVRRDHALIRICDIRRVMIEGRERADDTHHDGHGMRIPAEAAEEVHHLLVQHGVIGDRLLEFPLLVG